MVFDGGVVEDVVISNLIIETKRHDWFWWGDGEPLHFNIKKRSEVHRDWKGKDQSVGKIRRVKIQNVIARGMGSSIITGHPESWLEDITIDNLRLTISHDPKSTYDKAINALELRLARNFKLRSVDIIWEKPESEKWRSAVYVDNARNLEIDNLCARQAKPNDLSSAALVLNNVERVLIRNCQALPATSLFLFIKGERSKDIYVSGNELSQARQSVVFSSDVKEKKIKKLN